ncbi:RNA methyltransferase [Muricauda sp. 2012CJ35-5]|uniref:RNA methyltransferase n=1 Tax=Flagellimonas spongiicola TaxID=2942208 RepID=A0ABT0PNM0_9FLAO|nr:RNA methyltransferase [Allomuricauda spongiicola]MCL6272836.1 RNA methyltransferase [Allomuricauda spongiicola]
MATVKKIISAQNSLIKKVLLLKDKSRERRKTGLFVLEGKRELELAQKGDYILDTLLYCPELLSDFPIQDYLNQGHIQLAEVPKTVYEKLAYRGSTEGVMALVKAKEHHLDQIAFNNPNPLILIAEAPEKPGNIGALLRTADAAALDAVLIANPRTDLYNPNIIRSSVGCVFTNQIGMGTTTEIIEFLQKHNIKMYCAALTASKTYTSCDYKEATAIVVGTESIGLTPTWLEQSHQNIIIPMEGEIDSMNVSVSAAILIFEAKRQRGN